MELRYERDDQAELDSAAWKRTHRYETDGPFEVSLEPAGDESPAAGATPVAPTDAPAAVEPRRAVPQRNTLRRARRGLGHLIAIVDDEDHIPDTYLNANLDEGIEVTDPESTAHAFAFTSRLGDGRYPVWIGRTSSGDVACFVADMLVLNDATVLP